MTQYTAPNCPKCGRKMVKRSNRKNGKAFYGCASFPRCKGMLPLAAGTKVAADPASVKRITPEMESSEQTAIFSFGFDSHLMVRAGAGTGKTSTAIELLSRRHESGQLPGKVLVAAFNTAIASEMQAKTEAAGLPITVKTLHSHGFRAVKRKFTKARLATGRDNKTGLILDRLGVILPERGKTAKEKKARTEVQNLRWEVEEVVSLAKNLLLTDLDDLKLAELDSFYGKGWENELPNLAKLANQVLDESLDATFVDFDDMLWLPMVQGWPLDKFDVIVIDEAQDLNPVQHAMLEYHVAEGAKIVAIGDENQAIYGFRGANVDSMSLLEDMLSEHGGVYQLPLKTTRRCGKAIVELAQTIVPDYQAAENNPAGLIEEMENSEALEAMAVDDMILCRTNAPLIGCAFALTAEGKRPIIRGKEFGKMVAGFINKFQTQDIPTLMDKVEDYRSLESERLEGRDAALEAMNDRCDCVVALSEGCASVDDLQEKIAGLFDDDGNDGVILSTVHKAKGLEAKRVFILRPDLMPMSRKNQQDWQIKQEYNIQYVAYTRAIETLVLVGLLSVGPSQP